MSMMDAGSPLMNTKKEYDYTGSLLSGENYYMNSELNFNDTLFNEIEVSESANPGLSIQSNSENHESVASEFSFESPVSQNEHEHLAPQIYLSSSYNDSCDMMDFLDFREEDDDERYSNPVGEEYGKGYPNISMNSDAVQFRPIESEAIKIEKSETEKCTIVPEFKGNGGGTPQNEYFAFQNVTQDAPNFEDNTFEGKELLSSPPSVCPEEPLSCIPDSVIGSGSYEDTLTRPPPSSSHFPTESGYSESVNNLGDGIDMELKANALPIPIMAEIPKLDHDAIYANDLEECNHNESRINRQYDQVFDKGLGIYLSPHGPSDDIFQVRQKEPLIHPGPLHLRLNYNGYVGGSSDSPGMRDHNAHEILRGADNGHKSQSISKMPLAQMYAMMGLSGDHIKAKWREQRIIDIVRSEGFKVGSQTWIRDTDEAERFRIINSILFQCGREFGYDKALIEIIVRRGTYARMQSKLRQERRVKRRVIAAKMRNTNVGDGEEVNTSLHFHQGNVEHIYQSQQVPHHMQHLPNRLQQQHIR